MRSNYRVSVESIGKVQAIEQRATTTMNSGRCLSRTVTNDSNDVPQQVRPHKKNPVSLFAVIKHAHLLLLAGKAENAIDTLEHALALQAIDPCVSSAANMTPLLELLSGRRTCTAGTNCALRKGRAVQTSRVIIRTLGTFEVLVDGVRPGSRRKPANRPLGMLKVLVAQGGRAVSEVKLIDALWPDLEGDRAHAAYEVALHRLRKLLGVTDAVTLNHGSLSINQSLVWVDAFALCNIDLNSRPKECVELAHIALDIYRGEFLPQDTDNVWSCPARTRLHAKFINVIARAAAELEKVKDYARAATLYERGLAAGDLDDVMRSGMVRSLQKTATMGSR